MTDANQLIIRTLGTVAFELNGRSLTTTLSRKAQTVLIYLACQQRPVARELLTTLLWPDSAVEQGMTNLRKTLLELRRLLPEHLLIERQTVGMVTSGVWLDVAELIHCLQDTRATEEMRATAVALYRGPFLADFPLAHNPDLTAWAALGREQYQQIIIHALHRLVDDCQRQRRYAAGIAYARQLVGMEPLSEAASRALMLLLARGGQAQGALAEYERCRQQLAADLGVEPTENTQSLFDCIATAVTHPPALPLGDDAFVGRETELAQISQHLSDPNGRWLTIVGPGGVGKTRLALQAASEWTYDFLHGVHFVSLAAVDSPATLAPTIATALGAPLTGAEPPQQQLFNYLRQKEMLLLLDNCETLLTPALEEMADLLPGILQHAPQVRLVVTSREWFNYRAERVLSLSGLPFTEEASLRLFLARATQAQPDFVATPENLPSLRQICQLVEGLPLGLELAAAALSAHSPAQIAAEIGQTLDFLRRDIVHEANAGRHHSLRAVFESAWQRLSAAEQTTFARLSLFPGGFTAVTASAVADASPQLLLLLLDKSMLRLERERYRQHELLRQFAAEKLGDDAAVQSRFGRYYADFLQQQGRLFHSSVEQGALLAIEAEIDNARAAWNWLIAHGRTAEVSQAITPLHHFYDVRGRFSEGETIFGQAAAQWAARSANADGQIILGRLLARQGFFQERLGALDKAVDALQASLTLLQGRDLAEEAFVLNQLGLAVYGQGAYEQAESLYRRSLEISRRIGAVDQEAATLVNLGAILREQGQYAEARSPIEESLALLRHNGDRRQLAIALQVMGGLAEAEGAYAEAQAHFRQSLAICEQLDDRMGLAILCANLANIARQEGDLSQARGWSEQALGLFQEIGDPWGIAVSSVRLGGLALALADYEGARQLFQTSLTLCREMGDPRGTAVSLCNLGHVALALGLLPKARALFGEAIQVAESIRFLPWLLKSKVGLARVMVQSDELETAVGLATSVAQHPAADEETRAQAAALLADWRTL